MDFNISYKFLFIDLLVDLLCEVLHLSYMADDAYFGFNKVHLFRVINVFNNQLMIIIQKFHFLFLKHTNISFD